MGLYSALARPLLFRLDAETAHWATVHGLAGVAAAPGVAAAMRALARPDRASLKIRVTGLDFPNCVGLAAGLDKNAEAVMGFFGLGFGFIEVGTVTPLPQPGNPPPRLFRLPEHAAIINRMGFNNVGGEALAQRLRALPHRPGPVGVNLGKNKDTPLEEATADYLALCRSVAPLSDYVVVNLSSPNTPGLRSLQEPAALEALLLAVRKATDKALYLKIAPDLEDEAVDAAVDVARSARVDGLICTNTTITRPFQHALAGEAGGLSGAPLKARSTAVVRRAFRRSGGALPIIGVGGIGSAEDAWEKLAAGASLVQLYSALIFQGPALVRAILDGLESKLSALQLTSVAQAVGRDAG